MANVSDIKLLLTITPDVTLVGVSPVLDGFQRHPFYWYLLKDIDKYMIWFKNIYFKC